MDSMAWSGLRALRQGVEASDNSSSSSSSSGRSSNSSSKGTGIPSVAFSAWEEAVAVAGSSYPLRP